MSVTQSFAIDVNQVSMFSYINAKQADSGRQLRIKITVDGIPYAVPSSATAVFRAIKPDDTVIYNQAVINSDGTVTVHISRQCLAVVGKVYADVSIIHEGTTVSSVSFVIMVRYIPGNEEYIESSSEFGALRLLVAELGDYDLELEELESDKADGPGMEVTFDQNDNDILIVKKRT